ncbi:MAG: DUF6776 family protein [bacterium]|nr:hypothetical protein [Gammaproteobacteria bacterium]
MAAVKGSKQYQMVVVPYRPFQRAGIFCICLAIAATFTWLTYHYGLTEGLATKVEVIKEKEQLRKQLAERDQLVKELRREVAERKLGGQVDSKANEEVRQTVENLQGQIAALNEEVRFYKGVMLPNVEEQGLRIERLDVKSGANRNTFNYSLLLTQIVEKHDYIQGGVEITVVGRQGGDERELLLDVLNQENQKSIRFRFRYFQNINGELSVPDGFEPTQIMVVARSSGRNTQRLEKKFDWLLDGD